MCVYNINGSQKVMLGEQIGSCNSANLVYANQVAINRNNKNEEKTCCKHVATINKINVKEITAKEEIP